MASQKITTVTSRSQITITNNEKKLKYCKLLKCDRAMK